VTPTIEDIAREIAQAARRLIAPYAEYADGEVFMAPELDPPMAALIVNLRHALREYDA
jgi:hypothetical protein